MDRLHFRYWSKRLASTAVYGGAIALSCPLVFAVLPVSRKRAKVKWSHIWRVAWYSQLFVLSLAILMGSGIVVSSWSTDWGAAILGLSHFGGLILLPLCVIAFWQAAIHIYLVMSQSWSVALSVGCVAWLAGIAAAFYVSNPMSLAEMVEWASHLF